MKKGIGLGLFFLFYSWGNLSAQQPDVGRILTGVDPVGSVSTGLGQVMEPVGKPVLDVPGLTTPRDHEPAVRTSPLPEGATTLGKKKEVKPEEDPFNARATKVKGKYELKGLPDLPKTKPITIPSHKVEIKDIR